jgi:hypothetical protein
MPSRAGAQAPRLRQEQHQRPVGQKSMAAEAMQVAAPHRCQAAGLALIGERAVDEAVAQAPIRPLQGWLNGLFDMVGPRAANSKRLGSRAPASSSPSSSSFAIFSARRFPRLAGDETVDARARKRSASARAGSTCRPLSRLRG